MTEERNIRVRVGVQVLVCRDRRILLGRRRNLFDDNTWGLPGGQLDLHLSPEETLLDLGVRKLYEETGIIATDAKLFCVTDPIPESNYHMQIGVLVTAYKGTPLIKEPDFCDELDFFLLDDLPRPIFVGSLDVIRNYKEGVFYKSTRPKTLIANRAA